jgi:hypothetical protein
MEKARVCARSGNRWPIGTIPGHPGHPLLKPPELWVQDEVTNLTNRSTPLLAPTTLVGGLLACFAGCRDHDKAPPAPPPPLVDAAPRTPPADAARPGLGPFSSVRTRFERDCPPDLPSLHVHSTGRSCKQTIASSRRKALTRRVALHHAKDDSQPSDSTEMPISRIDVSYNWPAGNGDFEPAPECAGIVDEALKYFSELTGLTEQRARQAASAMRTHHESIVRFVAMDLEVCALSYYFLPPPPTLRGEGDEVSCGAMLAACHLFGLMTPPPIDVDLARVETDAATPLAHQAADEGGPNGRK